jgi:GNAT superfamily N-acetyltransferase
VGFENIALRHLSGEEARKTTDVIADVQARGYADAIATGSPFESTQAFMDRFDQYSRLPDFHMVVAELDANPVGQAFGWPLSENTTWWRGLTLDQDQPAGDEFTAESGTRTFALSELMVDKAHQGRGIAGVLFRALLSDRPESRVTWLVNPTNPAYAIYRHWGARKVGVLQPAWEGAPQFDVLIVQPLPS